MKTVNFLFGIHNHQPVGNFDHVFEEAFQRSYLPFIEVLERYPSVAMSLHYSGALLEWLDAHHPGFLDRIAVLVDRGNIEIMSGGFYEPILTVIPDKDKIGQIRKLSRFVRDRFDYDPRGAWLAERVWEPHLAKPLHEAGIRYIPVDDAHFIGAGKREKELTGYFRTEEQGKPLDIFPIQQKLRYLIPFEDPDRTIALLRNYATEEGDVALVMADDGEKFGVWPDTYHTVYEERWLDRFFQALEENSEWLKTKTFSEYHQGHSARGRVYLPTGSYFEMGEWSLPAHMSRHFHDWVETLKEHGELEEYQPFITGGFWRNFLSKYEESNWIHKRVLRELRRLENASGDEESAAEIRDNLWRATCNCAYWHGIFGGLYLPHLRDALYRRLLMGERALNEKLNSHSGWSTEDVDFDNAQEVRGRSERLQCFWRPENGAALVELDYLPVHFNLVNTLRRYEEGYHERVRKAGTGSDSKGTSIHDTLAAKESNLEEYLHYDNHPRHSFLDHFLPHEVTLPQMVRSEYQELGDFISGSWTVHHQNEETVLFTREGWIDGIQCRIEKDVTLRENEILVEYLIQNIGDNEVDVIFAPEMNFSLLGGHTEDRYYRLDGKRPEEYFLDARSEDDDVSQCSIVNEYDGFIAEISSTEPVTLWRYPVETVSMSEAGFERIYQSSVILHRVPLRLAPGESLEHLFKLRVYPTDNGE